MRGDAFESRRKQIGSQLGSLFSGYNGPGFSIRFWDGWHWDSALNGHAACTLVVNSPTALGSLAVGPNEVSLGEAFVRHDLDVEGDLLSAFPIVEYLIGRSRNLRQKFAESLLGSMVGFRRWLINGFRHSRSRDQASISYHYDLPVEFYRPWLGETLAYSCAYFRSADDCLDQAQKQKLELICQKLRLKAQERFLDIGCGWGSLVLHAAARYKTLAHGITLSQEQAEFAQQRVGAAGLAQRCKVEHRDYRDHAELRESFDKIASVGMFEHVGLRNLRQYFRTVYGLLKPGGTFLNHGIARSPCSPVRKSSFIDRYVFPDGKLVTLTQAINAAEAAGFEVRDVENLREHYELTLRSWVEGLQRSRESLLKVVSEATYRIWLLYTAGSSAAFHRGDIAVYQVLLSRPDRGCSRLPLLREDWYSAKP